MTTGTPAWAGLSPEEHEYQYNPQVAFPDFADVRTRLAPLNDEARETLGQPEEIAYGDAPLHRLDVFRAKGPGPHPVHVFYHGGYWRAQDKANFAFIAGALVPLGITTIVANYDLCPDATLDQVTASALVSFRWIGTTMAHLNGDPDRLTVSGHSAGAHLGAAIIADPGTATIPATLAGAVLTSGIFDPRPAIQTTVNTQLNLTEEIAARNDMERKTPVVLPDVCLLAGTREPAQWVDQTFRYYHHLRSHSLEPEVHLLPGHHHFDILEDYLVPDGITISAIKRQCGIPDTVA